LARRAGPKATDENRRASVGRALRADALARHTGEEYPRVVRAAESTVSGTGDGTA
jgi:hypothetical protein